MPASPPRKPPVPSLSRWNRRFLRAIQEDRKDKVLSLTQLFHDTPSLEGNTVVHPSWPLGLAINQSKAWVVDALLEAGEEVSAAVVVGFLIHPTRTADVVRQNAPKVLPAARALSPDQKSLLLANFIRYGQLQDLETSLASFQWLSQAGVDQAFLNTPLPRSVLLSCALPIRFAWQESPEMVLALLEAGADPFKEDVSDIPPARWTLAGEVLGTGPHQANSSGQPFYQVYEESPAWQQLQVKCKEAHLAATLPPGAPPAPGKNRL